MGDEYSTAILEARPLAETTLEEASRLATVLRFAIKEHYGVDSEKLVEFGMKPFRGRAKKSKPTLPEAPAPAKSSPAE